MAVDDTGVVQDEQLADVDHLRRGPSRVVTGERTVGHAGVAVGEDRGLTGTKTRIGVDLLPRRGLRRRECSPWTVSGVCENRRRAVGWIEQADPLRPGRIGVATAKSEVATGRGAPLQVVGRQILGACVRRRAEVNDGV